MAKHRKITLKQKQKKLLKLLRRDLSDLLFHFTKKPRKQVKKKAFMYSIPYHIDVEEFKKKLDHDALRWQPQNKKIFERAYKLSRNRRKMTLKDRSNKDNFHLLAICQRLGYSSYTQSMKYPTSTEGVLRKILFEKELQAGNGGIKGRLKCICFSEVPINELIRVFALAQQSTQTDILPKYEPYGIAVSKEWLYEKGGRPVIYQPDGEYRLLPKELKYRHKIYEPLKGIDYCWEREWRIHVDKLPLEPNGTLVVVPTADEAWALTYDTANTEPDSYDREGNPEGPIVHEPIWQCVSLDLLGVAPTV